MKKHIPLVLVVLIIGLCSIFVILVNNSNKKTSYAPYSFSLDKTPVVDEKNFDITGDNKTVKLDFKLPQAGYIKMLGYDSTEYDEWPDESTRLFVDFKDTAGNVLYDDVEITNGYVDKYLFINDEIIAEITFKNAPRNIGCITLSWAFAKQSDEPVELTLSQNSAAVADKNGNANYYFTAEKAGIYNVTPTEACIYECDCSFYIENENGENVSGDLSIHGTEWVSRNVFLPEGKYKIIISEIKSVATCLIKKLTETENVVLENKENIILPVTYGFTLLNNSERTVTFNGDGLQKSLCIETNGSDTFYDTVHTVEVIITDSKGNIIWQEICEEICEIDITKYKGEHTIKIIPNGTCMVKIFTKSN